MSRDSIDWSKEVSACTSCSNLDQPLFFPPPKYHETKNSGGLTPDCSSTFTGLKWDCILGADISSTETSPWLALSKLPVNLLEAKPQGSSWLPRLLASLPLPQEELRNPTDTGLEP